MLVKVSQMEFILNDGTNVDDSVDIHTVLPCANSIDQPLRDIGDLVCNLSIFFSISILLPGTIRFPNQL